MTTTLNVFRGLPIPTDYASVQKYAVLARSGGGKTYLTAKMLEQMCDAGLFFVVLDPVGKHWSLRVGPRGQAAGGKSDVVVLGGLHGDVPLAAEDGPLIADVVVEHPGRYVLDVSAFESDAEQDRFAHAFAKRLFRAKMKHPFAMLLVLEEAEAFIPQQPQPGQQPMLGAFARIQKMGRNYGIGTWLVTQRPQDISKKVLNQAEVLVVKQLAAKLELDAVTGWFRAQGMSEHIDEVVATIGSFYPEDAFVSSPSWLRVFKRTKVLKRVTFDSSASARHGDVIHDAVLKPLDVNQLADRLRAARDKAKASDPALLQAQIRKLEARLAAPAPAAPAPPPQVVEVTVPVAPFTSGEFDLVTGKLSSALNDLARVREDLAHAEDMVGAVLEHVKPWRDKPPPPPAAAAATPSALAAAAAKSSVPVTPPSRPAPRSPASNGQASLRAGALRMLTTLASMHPMALTRAQLGTLAKVKSSGGTFGTYLGELRRAGLIEEHGSKDVQITQRGFDYLGQEPPNPKTTDEILAMWRDKLRAGAVRMLDILTAVHPDWMTRRELGERAGIEVSGGTFGTYLGDLRRAGLIDEDNGSVRAGGVLYLHEQHAARASS